MDLKDKKIGFAMTGSFCTFKKVSIFKLFYKIIFMFIR